MAKQSSGLVFQRLPRQSVCPRVVKSDVQPRSQQNGDHLFLPENKVLLSPYVARWFSTGIAYLTFNP